MAGESLIRPSGDLSLALLAYGRLETRVMSLLSRLTGPVCAACGGECCRVEICRESLESDWLRMLLGAGGIRARDFDGRRGWRSPDGCRLAIGRPPVCYAFYCRPALDGLPDEGVKADIQAVAAVVPAMGARALGGRHLVCLTSVEIASRLDARRLCRRIAAAARPLDALADRMAAGCVVAPRPPAAPPRPFP